MANRKSRRNQAEPVVEVKKVIEEEKPVLKEETATNEYEVILATPRYFIIKRNGVNVVINKSNNYKKGDIVTL